MERVFKKPLLDENALCIYRQPGSVKGMLVRAGQWCGGSAGVATADGGPLVSHRFMRTRPPMGPLIGVSDEHLTQVPEGSPMQIAAEFVRQLAEDDLIATEPTRLVQEFPALRGDVAVEMEMAVASSGGRWRCGVSVNGVEVSSMSVDTHVDVLKDLAQQLQERDSILGHINKRKNSEEMAVSRIN